ncbi:hypothetical protein B0H11DRAFT_1942802 [Mycena galericulata]|nr:hypothetical protein B0H11DRAFT_1942802 [Mycena galericulata]
MHAHAAAPKHRRRAPLPPADIISTSLPRPLSSSAYESVSLSVSDEEGEALARLLRRLLIALTGDARAPVLTPLEMLVALCVQGNPLGTFARCRREGRTRRSAARRCFPEVQAARRQQRGYGGGRGAHREREWGTTVVAGVWHGGVLGVRSCVHACRGIRTPLLGGRKTEEVKHIPMFAPSFDRSYFACPILVSECASNVASRIRAHLFLVLKSESQLVPNQIVAALKHLSCARADLQRLHRRRQDNLQSLPRMLARTGGETRARSRAPLEHTSSRAGGSAVLCDDRLGLVRVLPWRLAIEVAGVATLRTCAPAASRSTSPTASQRHLHGPNTPRLPRWRRAMLARRAGAGFSQVECVANLCPRHAQPKRSLPARFDGGSTAACALSRRLRFVRGVCSQGLNRLGMRFSSANQFERAAVHATSRREATNSTPARAMRSGPWGDGPATSAFTEMDLDRAAQDVLRMVDLTSITKREIRRQLEAHFGMVKGAIQLALSTHLTRSRCPRTDSHPLCAPTDDISPVFHPSYVLYCTLNLERLPPADARRCEGLREVVE